MFKGMLILPSHTWTWINGWMVLWGISAKWKRWISYLFFPSNKQQRKIGLTMDNLSRRAESILSKFNCSQKTDWTRQYFYSDFKMFHPLFQWHCISVCCKGSGSTINLTFLAIKCYVQYKYFYFITSKVTWPKIKLCSVYVAFKRYIFLKYCFKTMVKHKPLLFKYIIKKKCCFQDCYKTFLDFQQNLIS